MCRLHVDTPSLMRVWFLELWEGCVALNAVYAHRTMGTIPQEVVALNFEVLRFGDWVLVLW